MDQEILKFSFMMCGVQWLCISPLGAQFTKMAANGSENAFCVLTFHECRSVTIVQRQFRTKFGKRPPSDNSIRRWYAQRWIGSGTDDDQMLLAWPPRSPDATPCDFFLWGYVKDQVYVPPLPASIPN